MKLLSTPRQPFVGLALMAATGIIVAEVVPLGSAALIFPAIVLAICILVALCWPKLTATYLIVALGFFLLHKFATTNTAGQQLADRLGERPRVVTAVGYVITEPKIAPNGCSSSDQLNSKVRTNPCLQFGKSVGKARRTLAMN